MAEHELLSRECQAEIFGFCKSDDKNKIIFVPSDEDKWYMASLILKRKFYDVRNVTETAPIYYVVSNVSSMESVYRYLSAHVPWRVVLSPASEPDRNVVIVTEVTRFDKSSALIFFDDCALVPGQQNVIRRLADSNLLSKCEQIICFSSNLVYEYDVDDACSNLRQIEVLLGTSIVTTTKCYFTKKYLKRLQVKVVAYSSVTRGSLQNNARTGNIYTDAESDICDLITNAYDENLAGGNSSLANNTNSECLMQLKKSILDISRYRQEYGLYFAYIVASILRVEIEKIKQMTADKELPTLLSIILTDLLLMRVSLRDEIAEYGSVNDPKTMIKCCCDKLKRLFGLFLRDNNTDNSCIIFTENSLMTRVVTYMLQVLRNYNEKPIDLKNITAEYLIDDSCFVLKSFIPRKKFYVEKMKNRIIKRFTYANLKVLVLPWSLETFPRILSADWLIFFDLPPDSKKFVISKRLANINGSECFIFLNRTAATGTADYGVVDKLVKVDRALQEIVVKKSFEYKLKMKYERNKKIAKHSSRSFETTAEHEVTVENAGHILKKYCAQLPHDSYSFSKPRVQILKMNENVVCSLQLPLNSSLKNTVESDGTNIEMAIRNVSFEAVKLMYKYGALDEYLNNSWDFNPLELISQWKENNIQIDSGSANRLQLVDMKFPDLLTTAFPEPNVDCYVHKICITPVYKTPQEWRKAYFHNIMASDDELGFITTKKLPHICKFPIYSDLGEVEVHIVVNFCKLKFTSEQLTALSNFHCFIFMDIMHCVPDFLVCDESNGINSYCIVPLKSENSCVKIDWKVINELSVVYDILKPSDEERINGDYSEENYMGSIVCPWYRVGKNYIVTKVLTDKSPESPISDQDQRSFSEYYLDKYQLQILHLQQPLLDARAITERLNFTKSREQKSSRIKKIVKEIEFPETLVPELCIRQPFPAVYWYKSTVLLSVLHRLHYLLLAETIRCKIAMDLKLGEVEATDDDVLLADDVRTIADSDVGPQLVPLSNILKGIRHAKYSGVFPWHEEKLPVDVDRNVRTVNSICLAEYCSFMKEPVYPPFSAYAQFSDVHRRINKTKADDLVFADPPNLLFLDRSNNSTSGPKQSEILKAITTSECEDIITMDRLKIFGKAYVNFAISLLLFLQFRNLHVDQLVSLKKILTSNKNVFYCSSKMKLAHCLKVLEVTDTEDWFPPRFRVPELFKNIIIQSAIWPGILFKFMLSKEEQMTGILSEKTRQMIHDKLIDFADEGSRVCSFEDKSTDWSESNVSSLVYFRKQVVLDKMVVDSIYAIIAAYVMNHGVVGGFKVLRYLDLINTIPGLDNNVDSKRTISRLEVLHKTLGYEFKNETLLLEALTHYSSDSDIVRNCNQKLAFIGDAVLEFLITGFVHEHHSHKLSVVQINDLLYLLINDVVYALLVIKYGLHKAMMYESIELAEKIFKLAKQQEMVDYGITYNQLLYLIEEMECSPGSKKFVPKALTNVFKAIAGAIFIDSGCNFVTVWKTFYNLMKTEIDGFSSNVPKSPVRLLEGTELVFYFSECVMCSTDANLVNVVLNVVLNETTHSYMGVGRDETHAQQTAVKLFLKESIVKLVL